MTTLTETLTRDDGSTSSFTVDFEACTICLRHQDDSTTLIALAITVPALPEEDIGHQFFRYDRVCADCRKAIADTLSDLIAGLSRHEEHALVVGSKIHRAPMPSPDSYPNWIARTNRED